MRLSCLYRRSSPYPIDLVTRVYVFGQVTLEDHETAFALRKKALHRRFRARISS